MMEQDNNTNQSAQHVLVDRIAWRELLHFPKMGRAAVLAFQPNRIIMGVILVVILMISGSVWDALAPARQIPTITTTTSNNINRNIADIPNTVPPIQFRIRDNDGKQGSFTQACRITTTMLLIAESQFLQLQVTNATQTIINIPIQIVRSFWQTDKLFLFIFGGWLLIVWCVFSGMICRSAACDFAVNQQIPWTEALAFSLRRWMNTVGSFALPLVVVLAGLVAIGTGGLLFHIPALNILGAALYGLALFGGFVIVCIIILTILGAVLFIPAVAVESADATDALARGYSYIKNRPLHFMLYMFLAIIIGLLSLAVVDYLAQATLLMTSTGAQLFTTSPLAEFAGKIPTSGTENLPDAINSGTPGIAAAVLSWWQTVVGAVVAGFIISYLCSAQTVIYFLMRKATDDQALDEIWIEGMIEGTLAPERLLDENNTGG